MLIERLLAAGIIRPRADSGGNAVTHIPQRHGLPLGTAVIGIDRLIGNGLLHLVSLKADVMDGRQYLNAGDLPVKFCSIAINRR